MLTTFIARAYADGRVLQTVKFQANSTNEATRFATQLLGHRRGANTPKFGSTFVIGVKTF